MPERPRMNGARWWWWLGAALLALSPIVLMDAGPAVAEHPAASAGKASPSQKSLYERLGGYDALGAFVRDFSSRLFADPKLGRYWSHRGKDGIDRELHLTVDYFAAKFGGPFPYAGRELKLSHAGMRIAEQDWQSLMAHLNATLDQFKVPQKERLEVVAFIESAKSDIVEIHQDATFK